MQVKSQVKTKCRKQFLNFQFSNRSRVILLIFCLSFRVQSFYTLIPSPYYSEGHFYSSCVRTTIQQFLLHTKIYVFKYMIYKKSMLMFTKRLPIITIGFTKSIVSKVAEILWLMTIFCHLEFEKSYAWLRLFVISSAIVCQSPLDLPLSKVLTIAILEPCLVAVVTGIVPI